MVVLLTVLCVVKELELVVYMVGWCVVVLLEQLLREGDVGMEMGEMGLERRRCHGSREVLSLLPKRRRRLRCGGGNGEEGGSVNHELREL